MRTEASIVCTINDDVSVETLTYLLETAGAGDIVIKTQPHFRDWLEEQPTESIPGLSGACLDWIRHWGNGGGGDFSTEKLIFTAVIELKSDVPVELAEAIFNSIADYSKTEFEAAALTMELIDGSISDLRDEKARKAPV